MTGLAALAVSVALLAGSDTTPAAPREATPLQNWWKRDAFCTELGLSPALRQELSSALDSLQTGYQLAQTRLSDARERQTRMMFDPAVSRDALVAFNRDEIAPLTQKMQQANLEARLLVRSRLTAAQIQTLQRTHPGFFTARWFRFSPVPVREGHVVVQEE